MATITRRLPQSKKTREIALTVAKEKKDSSPPSGNILSANTTTRLDALQPDYEAKMDIVAQKKYALKAKTTAKNAAYKTARTMTSAFIRSYTIGVELGEFEADARALYEWPSDGTFPKLNSEQDYIDVGKDIIEGDANRVAGGGAPMSRPTIADFTTAYNTFKDLRIEQNNLKEELDIAQEEVDALNPEADGVIKKVWDEVETFYNEEDKPSQRANAELWGVVYITVGVEPSIINGNMIDQGTGLAIDPSNNPTVYLEEPDLEVAVDENGNFSTTTTYIGPLTITGSAIGYDDNQQNLTLEEGSEHTLNFPMQAST